MAKMKIITRYESNSGFREAFSQKMGALSTHKRGYTNTLKVSWLDTPLGAMIAIADDQALYLLEFADCSTIERKTEQLSTEIRSTIMPGVNKTMSLIEKELQRYFRGNLVEFKTPLSLVGTPFQKQIWFQLQRIPHGETNSYLDIAHKIGRPTACRAVARVNSTNRLAIIIPCHRVINTDGKLGGYSSGLARKQWLIDHEQQKR